MPDVTSTVTASAIKAVCPNIRADILETILTDAPTEFPKAGLTDPVPIAHFFAQIATETKGLARLDEDLYYKTAARLMTVFKKKLFPNEDAAKPYLRNPEALANYVYAKKNGNTAPDDGWRYRGSGLIQLTGRGNFRSVDDLLGTHIEDDPEQARHPDSALAIALSYWTKRDIGAVAHGTTPADVEAVTKLVNTALTGLADRQAYFKKALRAFTPPKAAALAATADAATAVPVVAAAAAGPAAAVAPQMLAPELSGPQWVARFPTSQSISDLLQPFRDEAAAFVDAMRAAGARVDISATYRPKERAYLMHWAWEIAKGFDPGSVPPMAGVAIIWAHPTPARSVQAARQMVQAYGMKFIAALNSRHTDRLAIDMTISWIGKLSIATKDGGLRAIASQPRNGGNRELIAVGAGYGVIKLPSDPPHWSADGR